MKRKVKKRWVLRFFSPSAHDFFNEMAIFSANAPHMISQPTDQFLPTLLPPARHYWKAVVMWNVRWEIFECWLFFRSSAYLFFNEILLSVPMHHTWYRSPKTNFCHAAAAACQSSNNAKRMVRNRCVFFIAESFYSPFLSNCCLWGEHVICGCHGNCGWDNCSSCSAATAAAATVAVATEATAAAATLAAVMVAPAMATIFAQLLPPLQCIAQACRALQKEQWSINGESEVFALSQSFGRTTKDNGCDELGDNCNGGCAGLQT